MTGHRFFDDEGFEFLTLITLGGASYRLSEAGEVLATVGRIADGDFDSWCDEWSATADRVERHARGAAHRGHDQTARDAFLRASMYRSNALFYVLGTHDPDRELDCWRAHRAALDQAFDRWPTPVDAVRIPYEDTTLAGYFFSGGDGTRPLIVFNNGSDGTVAEMLAFGVADAVARGWHALVFDGPGQGEALFEQQLYFRHDWEAVITPVLDWAVARDDVDATCIGLFGCSQAGYWVPRAAAFERRLTAIAVDPGVVDVRTSWTSHLPSFLMDTFAAGDRDAFDETMAIGMAQSPATATTLRKRLEPYGTDSTFDVLRELERWNLTDVAGKIRCPVLITDPENEQFWPGQSRRLHDLLSAPRTIIRFRAADGANWHCEPMTPAVRSHAVLDWFAPQFAAVRRGHSANQSVGIAGC